LKSMILNKNGGLLNLIQIYTRHRQLAWEMFKRDVTDRYAGQMLGPLWAIGHPLFLMGIYVIVFTYIFAMRTGGSSYDFPLDYPTYILSGLIPWMAFQESMNRGSLAVLENSDLVKQVVFPLEILPLKGLSSALLMQGVATLFLIVYVVVKFYYLPITYVLLPLLFLVQFMAMTGISYILASVGAFVRDLKDIVQVFCVACFYCIPVLYFPNWMPSWIQKVLMLNPFSYMVWCYQDACFYGRIEHPWAWPIFFGLSFLVFYVGHEIFQRLKPLFGNVL